MSGVIIPLPDPDHVGKMLSEARAFVARAYPWLVSDEDVTIALEVAPGALEWLAEQLGALAAEMWLNGELIL